MSAIETHSLFILIGLALFGAVLGLLRLLQQRRLRSAAGAIERLQGKAARDLRQAKAEEKELREEKDLLVRPSLYGIPYLAWILTSLVVLLVFLILFFENLIVPYSIPAVGETAWHTYRAPARFELAGRLYLRHQVLLQEGATVTLSDRQRIERALQVRGQVDGLQALGTVLLLVTFAFILLYHINILYPSVNDKNRNLILIFLTLLVVLICAKLSLFYDLYSPYLIPVPWAGMMIAILVNRRIVPLTMLTVLIFATMDTRFDFSPFLVLLAGGLVSGSWVRAARRRSELMIASFLVALVMTLVYYCHIMLVEGKVEWLHADPVACFSNGILSGLMVLTVLPLFEKIFDFASNFRLMELIDLNTSILKEFFFKAPGSYQHTMSVANIAESVANEIGANGLLVRVGSYYHDIGKIFNPQFFVENQTEGKNPHDDLGPVASAAVLRSHVILGWKLAREIGLPGAVRDFIPEHHGTCTIDYFYHKSREMDAGMKSERIFKYPGPKPRSKETAIVMLVDSVESAFRSLDDRDEGKIRELVDRIINRKLEQGELDRSGLTIGELKKIADILTHVLKSSSHQRISYPSGEEVKTVPGDSKVRLLEDRRKPGAASQRSQEK